MIGRTLNQGEEVQIISKPRKSINLYAALAAAIIVVVCEVVFAFAAVFAITTTTNALDYSTKSLAEAILILTAFLVGGVIFFAIPALLNIKYRWQTVVATYLIQGLLVFVVLVGVVSVV